MAAKAFVYIVRCADNTLYTGWTTDVERRVRTHNAGRGAQYTRRRMPVELVYLEPQPSRADAMRREAAIKRWPDWIVWRITSPICLPSTPHGSGEDLAIVKLEPVTPK